ncbi:MAG: transcription-repair coupling factor [Lentisphaerae bacterium]|nr:transcription-repair coupling factor [Lentisphaerota bacterium]
MPAWRDILQKWARQAQIPSGACRFALHDDALLPLAIGQLCLARSSRLLVVAADSGRAEALATALSSMLKLLGETRPVIPLPEVALGRRQWIPENEAGRCAALDAALSGRNAIFVTTAAVLLSETITPKNYREQSFTLRKGMSIAPDALAKKLVELDYDNEFEVQRPGEFARRGGIMDIYSPLYDAPVRMEFWGDDIDSMRFFLPDTQRSFRDTPELCIVPRGMAMLEDTDGDKAKVHDFFADDLPLVLCAPDLIVRQLDSYADAETHAGWQALLASAENCVQLLTDGGDPALLGDAGGSIVHTDAISLGAELSSLLPELGDGAALWHWQQLRDNLLRWQRSGYTLVACCAGTGETDRFREILQDDPLTREMPIAVEQQELDGGLLLPSAKLVLLSDREIFGRKGPRRRHRHVAYRQDAAIHDAIDLEDGALAVHVTQGICIFHGIRTLESGGEVQDVIELEFADEVRLYVPLQQAHLISRYLGAGKGTPSLSRIGGVSWRNAKKQAADAAWDLAAELLRIEAMRQRATGTAHKPQVEWERSFAGTFPYEETADQQEAIAAVLADMENPKPMDRLLCGDAGYGKTEVAMRAAFRAVLNGKQVAVLVPTTVLAQQHYETFRERMAEFPVRIEMLSRFRSKGEQNQIVSKLALGEIDIVIGTHRLLQADVQFSTLGLLIIDEEQRFGVKDKQRFKALRANLDILTMTATPIPRTLYFSLSGIRNLSTIMTAPLDRLPVTTVVANVDKELIREAIRREMERGGQTFFLYNRVQTIAKMLDVLKELLPEARCAIAHGQMPAGKLEDVIVRFIRKEIDVLICTTIIESGIDIPNANTIIIDRADRFGLSELYQLRGRVGRHHRQGYAYLLLPPMGMLPENARQRLAAIRRYTQLGAGFKLALRDLEIRGAGNILGTEQSGHIAAVGFDLYCQLLKEAVQRLEKNSGVEPPREIAISFDRLSFATVAAPGMTAVAIPAAYVEDEGARVDCYKRLQNMSSLSELELFQQELRDRFGPLPTAGEALLLLTKLRILARKKDVIRLQVRERRVVIETPRGLVKDAKRQVPTLTSDNGYEQLQAVVDLLTRL